MSSTEEFDAEQAKLQKSVYDEHNYAFTSKMIKKLNRQMLLNQLSAKIPVPKKVVERSLADLEHDHSYGVPPLPIYPGVPASNIEEKKSPTFRFHKCVICDEFFANKGSLKRHINFHYGMSYECDVCGYRSAYLGNINNHKVVHTGIQYQCSLCLKLFPYISSVKRHQTMVHRFK
ncbi:hypothetical protein TYRP_002614 [Tyrophagus putrescentiae]|nr:hypothetical protein TYRP_002614 [Tyrophagus putrescentiae]